MTIYNIGVFEASCYRCGKTFYLPLDQKSPKWFIERLYTNLTAVPAFETLEANNKK